MRVVVLGAGFGGLELTTRLSEEFGDDVDVVLDRPGRRLRLRLLEARRDVRAHRRRRRCAHPYRDVVKPGVRFVQTDDARRSIPRAKRVETDAGTVRRRHAGGRARRRPRPRGHARAGRGRARVLHGRGRVRAARRARRASRAGASIVGVTSTPFKCPPAPSETALLVHDYLTERGLRERSEVVARDAAAACRSRRRPPASQALLAAFAERGIDWHPEPARARARPGAQRGRARRRHRAALRPVPRRARCTARRRSSPSRALPSTAGSRSTR